jgi:hypothetical protein
MNCVSIGERMLIYIAILTVERRKWDWILGMSSRTVCRRIRLNT